MDENGGFGGLWAFAIIGGPIILGIVLAAGMLWNRRRGRDWRGRRRPRP